MTSIASPEEVVEQIREDLKRLGYSVVEAARLMRKSPQSLYNILKGTHRISPQNARAFGDCFHYDYDFLTKGEGQLRYDREYFDDGYMLDLTYHFSPAERARLSDRERILDDYMEILRVTSGMFNDKHFPLSDSWSSRSAHYPVTTKTRLEEEIISRIYFFAHGIEEYINLPHFFELFERGEFWKKGNGEDVPDFDGINDDQKQD